MFIFLFFSFEEVSPLVLTVLDMAKMGLLSLDQQLSYSVSDFYTPFLKKIGSYLPMSVINRAE